jgi:hypothetical protein
MPLPTLAIPGFDGLSHTVNTPNSGRQAAVDSAAAALSTEDKAVLDAISAKLAASIAVTGTFWQATQPVSNAGTFAVQAAQSGTWNVGTVTTVTTVSTVTNLSQFGGAAINLGAGAVGTGTLRTTQASDSPLVTATGAIADTAWASGSGSMIALLKTVATAALDTTPSSVKIDQTTDGTTNKVAVGNSPAANTAKSYTGTFVVAATALTRPANTTAYTALDSISNNATAGSVTANSVTLSDTNDHPIDISEILLASTDTGPGTAAIQIRLHLFNSDPTASTGVVGGDNAAWSNKQAGWVGSFSGTMRAFSDGSRGVLIADEGTLRLITPVSGAKTLYWQLQAIGGFTPSANSTTFTPTFKGFQARAA